MAVGSVKKALYREYGQDLAEALCLWPELGGAGAAWLEHAALREEVAGAVRAFARRRLAKKTMEARITPPLRALIDAVLERLLALYPGKSEVERLGLRQVLLSPEGRLALLVELSSAQGPLLDLHDDVKQRMAAVLIAAGLGKIDRAAADRLADGVGAGRPSGSDTTLTVNGHALNLLLSILTKRRVDRSQERRRWVREPGLEELRRHDPREADRPMEEAFDIALSPEAMAAIRDAVAEEVMILADSAARHEPEDDTVCGGLFTMMEEAYYRDVGALATAMGMGETHLGARA